MRLTTVKSATVQRRSLPSGGRLGPNEPPRASCPPVREDEGENKSKVSMTKSKGKAVARVLAAELAKKQPKHAGAKKKKKSLGDYLRGAASFAAKVAPAIIPMLLSTHAPSMVAAAQGGVRQATSAGVPIAAGVPMATQTGLRSMKSIMKDGRVIGVELAGCDYLRSINSAGTIQQGDLLCEIDLDPMSEDWSGTRAQREASLWQKGQLLEASVMVQAACPTLTPGQMIAACVSDPNDVWDSEGREAVQVMSATQGAEMFQSWQTGCAPYIAIPGTQDFYLRQNGSDERLISPGKARVVAASPNTYVGPLSEVYIFWRWIFMSPILDTDFTSGPRVFRSAPADLSAYNPNDVSDNPFQPVGAPGSLLVSVPESSTLSPTWQTQPGQDYGFICGLPVGRWLVNIMYSISSFTPAGAWQAVATAGGSAFIVNNFTGTGARQPVGVGFGFATCQIVFDVFDAGEDWTRGALNVFFAQTGTASGTPGQAQLVITELKNPDLALKKKSLQDYEKDVEELKRQMVVMSRTLATVAGPAPYDPAAPPVGPTPRSMPASAAARPRQVRQ